MFFEALNFSKSTILMEGEDSETPVAPGFCYIPNSLDSIQQCQLAKDCLKDFTQPPATTNHSKEYGPIPNLWEAAQQGLSWKVTNKKALSSAADQQNTITATSLASDRNGDEESDGVSCNSNHNSRDGLSAQSRGSDPQQTEQRGHWIKDETGVAGTQLLSKLRWASLGPNFDWTARRYLYDEPQQPLPQYIVSLAQRSAEFAQAASKMTTGSYERDGGAQSRPNACNQSETIMKADMKIQSPIGLSFLPDAALVNYYKSGETLGGHKDDVEADLTKPIVSISIGCDAIFLLGGDLLLHFSRLGQKDFLTIGFRLEIYNKSTGKFIQMKEIVILAVELNKFVPNDVLTRTCAFVQSPVKMRSSAKL